MQHFIVGNYLYKPFLSPILQGVPNRLQIIVFVLSAEHDPQARNIGSKIKLDVDVVGLMDEADELISVMTCASFG